MTPEQNLDEDILQCRAEIQRALGQDSAEEAESSLPKNQPAGHSDSDVPENSSHPVEMLIEEPKEEELIEDWIEEQSNSNSGSFAPVPSLEEETPEEITTSDKKNPEAKSVPPDNPDTQPQKLFFPKDLETYNKILKTLREQKENLTETCKEQEKHILNLADQMDQLRRQYRQADHKNVDLAAQVQRLAEFEQISRRLERQLQEALDETDILRRELTALQHRHQETIQEKDRQAEQVLSQRDRLRSLEQQQESMTQELQSLRRKNEDLLKTLASFNHENEQLRQEKTSLHQQVHSLQQGLARQQTESQQSAAVLREELAAKTEQLEHRQIEYDRLAEQLRAAQAQIQSLEQSGDLQRQAAPEPEPLFPIEKEALQEPPVLSWLREDPDTAMPRFDLSDQILASQRMQNSGRRQPPSAGRTSPTDNIRKVVQQFVTAPAPVREHRSPAPAHPSFAPPPSPQKEFERPGRRSGDPGDQRQPLIAEIVQRDIENFCRQHQWVFIEFPSG